VDCVFLSVALELLQTSSFVLKHLKESGHGKFFSELLVILTSKLKKLTAEKRF
jgi:hypothetical protein